MDPGAIVIVGGGQAGFQAAASLRKEGVSARIVLIEAQDHLPYQRPPLSKAFLQGKMPAGGLPFRPRKFFDDNRIELVNGRAQAVDRKARQVILSCGTSLAYEHLILCVGAKARRLPIEGAALKGVFELRTLADADALRIRLGAARRVVVIGAGFVGIEFAAVARASGDEVQVVEAAPRPLARAVSQAMSDFIAAAHRRRGIALHTDASATRLEGENGQVTAVELADGTRITADIVLVGIGVEPDTELASGAGLSLDNGIAVDDRMLTSDPAISAIGDCVSFPCPRSGERIRLESVQNACDQAHTVAARLAGKPARYTALPWFWSDQGDLKLQMAGLFGGQTEVQILPSAGDNAFCALVFREGRFVAIECVNRPGEFVAARKLLAQPCALRLEEAARPDFDLRMWEAASRTASGVGSNSNSSLALA